ncbi:hypothetical protein DJ82_12210 [Halorubrum sp. Ib24]|uniref:hypothetical protein n=1 Tax=unclassified Halorubrum TaxID=2642239 RepID=UPI000B98266A|nr:MULTISPECIES: hypothetical protein [unclassified Halorubrum]OYR38345.1 hypothetical protein DJ82_12210 [Halorubrum sp. Ib24]OYR47469.1 hypothetical protein DJ74_12610 [Halorubrum sp. Ea8]
MPLRAHHVSPPSTARRRPTQPVADVPFDDLVSLLAAGVADAQTALDAHSAATGASLAETELEVVPSVTRTIDTDGSVTATPAATERRSLLELGITPAWYRFSEATIEVEADVRVAEREGNDAGAGDDGTDDADRLGDDGNDPASGLTASTQSVIDRRRFDREVGANARLAARLEPTPLPRRVGPPAEADAERGGDRAD